MTEDRPASEDLQNPLVHEGAEPDDRDSNESADEKVEIQQPDGDAAPRADPTDAAFGVIEPEETQPK